MNPRRAGFQPVVFAEGRLEAGPTGGFLSRQSGTYDRRDIMTLDDTDRRLIRATQAGLPLTPRPYHAIAATLGLSPDEVMDRLRHMQETGIIRRIGVVPNHYRLGYTANGMTVWDVPDDQIDVLGDRIGALASVSHCYHRPRHPPDWPYNFFAMVHGRSRDAVQREVLKIAGLLGEHNRGHAILYSTRILKKTGLRIGD